MKSVAKKQRFDLMVLNQVVELEELESESSVFTPILQIFLLAQMIPSAN
jgi:hypothetical protein